MSPLERLHAEQREHVALPSDHALTMFLAECSPITALADREPTTQVERRHLARIRRTA